MKHTKKVFKSIFGGAKKGVKYVTRLNKLQQKAPVLFIYPTSGDDTKSTQHFITWISEVVPSEQKVSVDEFIESKGAYSV